MEDKISERIKQTEEFIETCRRKSGLGTLNAPESEKYVNATAAELNKMDSEELSEAAVALNRCALYINGLLNKATATKNWCQSNLDSLIAKQFTEYDPYLPAKIKTSLCVQNNELAKKLQKFIVELELVIDSLTQTPLFLNNLSYSYNKLADRKRRA